MERVSKVTKGGVIVRVKAITSTQEILDAARTTVWKDRSEKEPSDKFLHGIYRAEHSPIRDRLFVIELDGVKSWVATHFARHNVGSTPYISTQRDDRISKKRDAEAPVLCRLTINSQGLIDMSQRRLCLSSHKETVTVMEAIHACVKEIDPLLAKCMVPQCVYRGFCPEGKAACYKYHVNQRLEYVLHQTGENYYG